MKEKDRKKASKKEKQKPQFQKIVLKAVLWFGCAKESIFNYPL